MLTDINTRESYIVIGTSVNADNTLNNELVLPAPIEIPSSDEFMANAERNANGTMVIQEIGRTQYTTSIKWGRLPAQKWWEINRWFQDYGYVFYMKYFSHTDGKVKINRFYRGNIEKGAPSHHNISQDGLLIPTHYSGCGFNVIDMGEDEVIVLKEIGVN